MNGVVKSKVKNQSVELSAEVLGDVLGIPCRGFD